MDRGSIIAQIKDLINEANQSIAEKRFAEVSDKYAKISRLCKNIGDEANAAKYQEAAERFYNKALEFEKYKDELQATINQAVNAANAAYQSNDFQRVSDIYFKVANMLHELGDAETAKKFLDSANQFRERAALEAQKVETIQDLPATVQESAQAAPISELNSSLDAAMETLTESTPIPFTETSAYEKPRPPLSQTAPDSVVQIPQPAPDVPEHLAPSALSSFRVNINKLDNFLTRMDISCPNCGNKITGVTKVCPKCNTPLKK